ncbi:MAG TPA: hypothetical protein VJU86_13575 [Pyrinomonadaceae bacterium]|nr:hypothetical protein [Pyrinomonadaceae bacterium]
MNNGTLFWIIIFAISALTFFVVAAVVAVKGVSDLRHLLRPPGKESADR